MGIATQFVQAASRFQQGHIEVAQRLAQSLLEQRPDEDDANFLLGILAALDGYYDVPPV